MAIEVRWQPGPGGQVQVWSTEAGRPIGCLFSLHDLTEQETVQRWAEQADSLPEFLEMIHLEGLIDLTTLRSLLLEHSPLHRLWGKLRVVCEEAGDIGEYPAPWIMIGTAEEAPSEGGIHLRQDQVTEALAAWGRFEVGDDSALSEPTLAVVVGQLAYLAGQRLGLYWDASIHFGDWLSGLITGWLTTHGNEEELWRLEGIAAQAAADSPQHIGPACYNPEVWDLYRPAIAAVVRALSR